jgi:hypothetical protein
MTDAAERNELIVTDPGCQVGAWRRPSLGEDALHVGARAPLFASTERDLSRKRIGMAQGHICRFASAVGALLVSFFWATSASAFCRTTVCDPSYSCEESPDICCVLDPVTRCEINAAPLSWPTSCVSYAVHEDGSDKRDISAKQLSNILDEAFSTWLSSDCNGSSVSLAVDYRGGAECGAPEYNLGGKDRHANIWMFRELQRRHR